MIIHDLILENPGNHGNLCAISNMDTLYNSLKQFGKVRINEPMAKHTTFKIGGPAKYFVVVQTVEKAKDLLAFLDSEGIARVILGGGSNVLFSDEGFDGTVIKIQDTGYKIQDTVVEAAAGALMKVVSEATIAAGLTGFEWAIGVPGTVAGALRGNAAYNGVAMEDCVESVEVYRDGEVLRLANEDCQFSYKESIFKRNSDVILSMRLRLQRGDKARIAKDAIDNMTYRKETQPKGYGSAGCTFKNIVVDEKEKERIRGMVDDARIIEIMDKYNKVPAGRLIDLAGLKGVKAGDAEFSDVHANFIVNLGKATARDVLTLIEMAKEKVYDRFGIQLEEEIQII